MSGSPRRAIVYFPSTFSEMSGDTALAMAHRIARALDRSDPLGGNRYEVENRGELHVGDLPARRARVVRRSGETGHPIVDVFDFRYPAVLGSRFRSSNPVVQALRVLLLVAGRIRKTVGSRRGPASDSLKERLQILYGAIWLLVIAAYIPFIVAVALDALLVAMPGSWDAGAVALGSVPYVGDFLETVARWWTGARPVFHAVALGFVAVGVLLRKDLKAIWLEATSYSVPAAEYLRHGAHGGAVRGRIADLLETVVEDGESDYESLEFWAYSLGAVIALDVLFPASGEAVSERIKRVDRLVTVGAPIGFLDIFFPEYFEDVRRAPAVPGLEWVNVYCPHDLLATRFDDRDEDERVSPEAEWRPTEEISYTGNNSPVAWWRFGGFSAHQEYWDPGLARGDHNAIDVLAVRCNLIDDWADRSVSGASTRDGISAP